MPSGADAVVMVEYTNSTDGQISVFRAVSINENVMHAGADIMAGERVLKKGTYLGAGKWASLQLQEKSLFPSFV